MTNQWVVHYAQLFTTHKGLSVSQTQPSGVVHTGAICETGVTCSVNGDRTLFDFFTDTVTPDGRVAIAWTNDSATAGAGQVWTTLECGGTNLLTGKDLPATC